MEFQSHQDVHVDLKKHKRGFEKIKKGSLPSTPKNVAEIINAFEQKSVIDSYGVTLQTIDLEKKPLTEKYRFYDVAVEEKGFSYCIFSSKVSIQLIEKHIDIDKRHILMDATFKTCPSSPFKQLLILYIRTQKKVNLIFFFAIIY